MPKTNDPTFEEAMQELDEIMVTLSAGAATLDESLQLYARAAHLVKSCHAMLQSAQVQMEEISLQMQEVENQP